MPASLPRTFRFNETVGIDLLEVPDPWRHKHTLMNVLCWGTLFQLVPIVPDKTAETIGMCLAKTWMIYFGLPATIIGDLGPEFMGGKFQEQCDRN